MRNCTSHSTLEAERKIGIRRGVRIQTFHTPRGEGNQAKRRLWNSYKGEKKRGFWAALELLTNPLKKGKRKREASVVKKITLHPGNRRTYRKKRGTLQRDLTPKGGGGSIKKGRGGRLRSYPLGRNSGDKTIVKKNRSQLS